MMAADQQGVWDDNRYYSSSYSCYEKCRHLIRKGAQKCIYSLKKRNGFGKMRASLSSSSRGRHFCHHYYLFATHVKLALISAGTSEEFTVRNRKAKEKWCILFLYTWPGETLVSSSTCHHWTLPFRKAVHAKFRSIPEDKKKFNALYTLFKDKSESDEVIYYL